MTEQQRRDLEKMQNDAIKRMRDLSSKGQQQMNMPPSPDFVKMRTNNESKPHKEAEKQHSAASVQQPSSQPISKGFNLLKMLNLNNFKMDSDFSVIIAMILLLSSEESDELLLLALLYIML